MYSYLTVLTIEVQILSNVLNGWIRGGHLAVHTYVEIQEGEHSQPVNYQTKSTSPQNIYKKLSGRLKCLVIFFWSLLSLSSLLSLLSLVYLLFPCSKIRSALWNLVNFKVTCALPGGSNRAGQIIGNWVIDRWSAAGLTIYFEASNQIKRLVCGKGSKWSTADLVSKIRLLKEYFSARHHFASWKSDSLLKGPIKRQQGSWWCLTDTGLPLSFMLNFVFSF